MSNCPYCGDALSRFLPFHVFGPSSAAGSCGCEGHPEAFREAIETTTVDEVELIEAVEEGSA